MFHLCRKVSKMKVQVFWSLEIVMQFSSEVSKFRSASCDHTTESIDLRTDNGIGCCLLETQYVYWIVS